MRIKIWTSVDRPLGSEEFKDIIIYYKIGLLTISFPSFNEGTQIKITVYTRKMVPIPRRVSSCLDPLSNLDK